jgi:dimethylsulfone monooxygenase
LVDIKGSQTVRRESHPVFSGNKFKLGLFSANCSGGMSSTKVPERWVASWDNNRALAVLADEAGLDFLLPVARWKGFGGATDFQGASLETIVWATGMLAATRKIGVFATVHTAFFHPVIAAKQLATADHIGAGRLGVNVVFGWNKQEYDMLGLALPEDNADRYAYGEEWFDIVCKLWSSEAPFDWEGKFFHLQGAVSDPKPALTSLPPIFNAGSSPTGRDFAIRRADFLLTSIYDIDQSAQQARAILEKVQSNRQRDFGIVSTGYVVCRSTMKEANEYHEYYANEYADWEAADRLMHLQSLHRRGIPPEVFKQYRSRYAGGYGAYPIVGDPDHVADVFELIHNAGFAGSAFSFVNYLDELPFFRDEVLPRLERKGLREPAKAESQ